MELNGGEGRVLRHELIHPKFSLKVDNLTSSKLLHSPLCIITHFPIQIQNF